MTVTREEMRLRALEEIDVLRAAIESDCARSWRDADALALKAHHIKVVVRDYSTFSLGDGRGFSEGVTRRLRHLLKGAS